jgi:formate-dependent nitrite reductase membrane component NrfD
MSQAPHWEWYYVALYFFIGGTAAGAYFIGSMAELFGGERHREISRTACQITLPLLLVIPVLLIADLGRPERFWHLFLYPNGGVPYINLQSPLSVGSWVLLAFGGFALLSFLDNLVSEGRFKSAPFSRMYNRIPRRIYALNGSVAGIFIAGYTGVLLNVTARPLWAATSPLLGALFIASGVSGGAAAIALFMLWRKVKSDDALERLGFFDRVVMVIELVLIAAIFIAAGRFAAPLSGGVYGVMFWGGTVVLGILMPLGLYWYARRSGTENRLLLPTSILVLIGGALLRISLLQAGQI